MDSLDFSDNAVESLYEYESFGRGEAGKTAVFSGNGCLNGYAHGKRMLDITVSMWFKTLNSGAGWLPIMEELYSEFPAWWLDNVFKDFFKLKADIYGYDVRSNISSRVLNSELKNIVH